MDNQYERNLSSGSETKEVPQQEMDEVKDTLPKNGGSMTHVDEKKSVASQIVDAIIMNDNVELWHSDEGIGYVSMHYLNGRYVNRALKDKGTKQLISGIYHAKTDKVANSSALSDAITVLEGYAMNGKMYPTFIRVAHSDNAIYIDLGDKTYDAIKITSSGWEVTKDIPVKFRRPKGIRPLPFPEKG